VHRPSCLRPLGGPGRPGRHHDLPGTTLTPQQFGHGLTLHQTLRRLEPPRLDRGTPTRSSISCAMMVDRSILN
jgi:hypothetical protein